MLIRPCGPRRSIVVRFGLVLLALATAVPRAGAATGPEPGQLEAAAATVWHVAAQAPGGGDGSPGRPFASISDALAVAEPGDTVDVGPGDYPGKLRTVRAGAPGAPIRLIGHGAHLHHDGTSRLLQIDHDHVHVEGFELSGANILITISAAQGVVIAGNALHDAGSECLRLRDGASFNLVARNWIRNCGVTDFTADRLVGEGIYVGTAPENTGGERDASLANAIDGNDIAVPGECVDIKEGADGTVVQNNTCIGSRYENSAGIASRARWTLVRWNVSTGHAGAGVMLAGDRPGDGVDNMVIENVLVANAGYGLKVVDGPQLRLCGNRLEGNGRAPTTPAGAGADLPC